MSVTRDAAIELTHTLVQASVATLHAGGAYSSEPQDLARMVLERDH